MVAFLFSGGPTGEVNGQLAKGSLEEADLLVPYQGNFDGFIEALKSGELYVNVHTTDIPPGELRGSIGAN